MINKRCFRQVLAFCLILFFPFNNTISGSILFGGLNPYVFLAAGFFLLVPDIKKKFSRKTMLLIIAEVVMIMLALLNIQLSAEVGYITIQLAYLLLLPILIDADIDERAVTIAITIFAIEHILGTLFPILLPGLYENSFLSFVCKSSTSYCPARIAFESGMNAGITKQSSTNGCYMAIFALFFTSKFINKPSRGNSILAVITIACLLIIGKRAHFLFTIISLFIVYITKKDNFSPIYFIKNNIKIIIVGTISLFGIIAFSNIMPQIGTTLDRIAASRDSDDVTSRREPLYELAVEKWEEAPFFGNGWGAYTFASHEKFGVATYGSDYMHAHNDYLELLCDIGIIGTIMYSAILVWIIRGTYRIRNGGYFQKFSFAYMIFFVLYGLTGTPLYIISTFVFLLVTIIIKEKGIKKDEKNRRDNV